LHRLNHLSDDHSRRRWFDENHVPALRLEVSLAFYDDRYRRLFDVAAPSVENRMQAIRRLSREGLSVFPRIDPLFPRDPLRGQKTMADFALPDVQSLDDLQQLIVFGRELNVAHIIYSVAEITQPRQSKLPTMMERMKRACQHVSADQPLEFRGGSWRLPTDVADAHIVEPFLALCRKHSLTARSCKANLLTTP
jgi:hypothetical protein